MGSFVNLSGLTSEPTVRLGAGLLRAREILPRWRRETQIDRSLSGQGTTFTVKLRAADKQAGKAEAGCTLHGGGPDKNFPSPALSLIHI